MCDLGSILTFDPSQNEKHFFLCENCLLRTLYLNPSIVLILLLLLLKEICIYFVWNHNWTFFMLCFPCDNLPCLTPHCCNKLPHTSSLFDVMYCIYRGSCITCYINVLLLCLNISYYYYCDCCFILSQHAKRKIIFSGNSSALDLGVS